MTYFCKKQAAKRRKRIKNGVPAWVRRFLIEEYILLHYMRMLGNPLFHFN